MEICQHIEQCLCIFQIHAIELIHWPVMADVFHGDGEVCVIACDGLAVTLRCFERSLLSTFGIELQFANVENECICSEALCEVVGGVFHHERFWRIS